MDQAALVFDNLALSYVLDDPWPERMVEGGVFGACVTLAIEEDWEQTLFNLDEAFEKIARHPRLALATRRSHIDEAREAGQVAIVPAFQAASMVAGRAWRLRTLHRLGLRCLQVTYTAGNLYGSGLGELVDGGLTFAGRDLVEEANALGILLDASHCGPKTSADIVEHSRVPVVFTHANSRAVCPNPRNKPDEVIRALAERGGVLGVTTLPRAVRVDRQPTLEDYLDMMDYVVKLVGADHVGVGSDFTEGYKATGRPIPEADRWRRLRPDIAGDPQHFFAARYPIGIEGHAEFRNVATAMERRGYTPAQREGILGGNFLRLFERVVG